MTPRWADRWLEISIEADRESVDDLVGLLGRHCPGGAAVEYRPVETLQGVGERATVKGFLPACDKETCRKLEIVLLLLGQTSPISAPQIRTLEPRDWSESWKAFFPPQHIGARTVIVPTWRDYTPGPGEVVIRLDPGMAFGTGLHASTRLCLIAMERLPLRGAKVLDVGTGSGILAIAAALQGAKSVKAIDIDPVAVRVAQDNAALNRVAGIVQVERTTLGPNATTGVSADASGFDILLVNILAETIVEMGPAIAGAMRVGGVLVASGVICEKTNMVTRALAASGLVIDDRLQEDDWVALVGHKA